jgi:P4 family phage/plasmid primase-like protien
MLPTRIHATGHGLHGVYVLDKPWHGDIQPALHKLAEVVCGDHRVCHPAALLRMPGTHNSKDGDRKLVRVTETGHYDPYKQIGLELWLSTQAPVIQAKDAPASLDDPFKRHAQAMGFKPPIDAEARLRAMRWKGPGDTAIHQTQLQVTASLLEAGLGVDEVVERVLDATREAVQGRPDWNWDREEQVIRGMCVSWRKEHPAKLEKKRKPLERRPDVEIVDVDRRDEPELAGAQIISMAAKKLEYELKEGKKSKSVHVILSRGLIEAFKQRGERLVYESRTPSKPGAAEGMRLCHYRSRVWVQMVGEQASDWLNVELERGCQSLEVTSRNNLISEARGWLKRQPDLVQKDIPWDEHGGIATQEGLLNLTTMRITPLQPEHYATHRIECVYDPDATCPMWERALADAVPDKKTVEVIQEVAGAALLDNRSAGMRRALVLIGDTNTGKSTILNVVSGLLCDEPNVTPLETLDKDKTKQDFLRPVPWVLHEAFDQGKWYPSATVKMLLSADPVHIDVKYSAPVTHRFKQAVLWGTNPSPQFKESSRAIASRILSIRLFKKFDKDHPTGVEAKARQQGYESLAKMVLDLEKPGILNWAIEGLKRLQARNGFEQTEEMQQTAHEIHLEQNRLASAIEELVTFDPNCMVSTGDFYTAYLGWFRETHGHKKEALSLDVVGRELAAYSSKIGVNKTELRFNKRRYYAGICLNEDGMDAWEQGRKQPDGVTTEAQSHLVNREIPLAWVERAVIKRIRSMYE